MKKEKYKVYTYSYEYGWEKFIKHNKEDVYDFISSLDPYEYSQYIVVQELSDRDLPIDNGFIAKPKKLTKKRKK